MEINTFLRSCNIQSSGKDMGNPKLLNVRIINFEKNIKLEYYEI